MYVVCGIHLEKVKPAIPLLVLEMARADFDNMLIIVIRSSITSPIHVFCHVLLMFLDVMLFTNFTCAYSTSHLASYAPP